MTQEQAMDKFYQLQKARFNGEIVTKEGLNALNEICKSLKKKFKEG